MTNLEALQRAILHTPDDNTPRLIYADALEETGESDRAAAIRLEIEASTLPSYDPIALRYEYQHRRLFAAADMGFELPPLPPGIVWMDPPFRRGFPGAVRAENGGAFLDGADRLFEIAPVESLDLQVLRAVEVHHLAECRWLERLNRLAINAGLGRALARMLFNSPHLRRLRELQIGGGLTSPQTAAAVVGSRVFRRLAALSYRDEPQGGEMVAELTRLADPPQIQRLDLAANQITPERLFRLLEAPALEPVDELDLSDNNLGSEGLRVMAVARLPALRSLRLTRVRPDNQGISDFTRSALMENLHALTLAENFLGVPVAQGLASTDRVANLRLLDLSENRLGNMGAAELAEAAHFRNLMVLDLSANEIEDAGARALAESPHLDGLIFLDLSRNWFQAGAVEQLRERFGDRIAL